MSVLMRPMQVSLRMRDWMLIIFAALVALLGLLGWLASVAIDGSRVEVVRAQQSLAQLENIRAIEAAFGAYLLEEVRRRLNDSSDTGESQAAAELRGALLIYRRTISEEIALSGTEAERAAERREMVRATALAGVFEAIETESRLERTIRARTGGDADARGLLNHFTAERDALLRTIVAEVVEDERGEAAAAFERLDQVRVRATWAAGGLAAAFLAIALGLGYLSYRGLLRPIHALTALVEQVPGAIATRQRAPERLPGEFAILARGFNAMADRIATEQERLATEVAARTSDLAEVNRSLRAIDESRRAFFANVSHELRTPVTVLLGEAQIALRMPGEERGALERIAANGGVLRRRIDDLMRLARSEDGALELAMAPTDVGVILDEAVAAARAYATASEVTIAPFEGGELTIEGDREALSQAALALIDNAVKYSGPGGHVAVRLIPNGFEVIDSGPGFGDMDPEALFGRYVQAAPDAGRGGAGLGLAIVGWIARQHGARLLAETRAEGGARVAMVFAS